MLYICESLVIAAHNDILSRKNDSAIGKFCKRA